MADLYYLGPADDLYLEEGGKAYHPGDKVHLSNAQRTSLTAVGMQFGYAHDEQDVARMQARLAPPTPAPPGVLLATAPPVDPQTPERAAAMAPEATAPTPEPQPDPEPDDHPARHSRTTRKDAD